MNNETNNPTRSTADAHEEPTAADTKKEYCVDLRLAEISEFAITVEADSQEKAELKAKKKIEQEHHNCGCSGCPYYEVSVISSWPVNGGQDHE
jgi:hypothetical protein